MGCKSSKDGGQPKAVAAGGPGASAAAPVQNPTPATSPEKKGTASQGATPAKSPGGKSIKEISGEQLKKHKPADLLIFAKQGNLAMVNGIVNHYGLQKTFVCVKGLQEEFTMGKGGKKVPMAKWNPLLVAIAFKKIEIVRYFINDLGITLAAAGACPDFNLDARFALQLALANQDLPMVQELWSGS